jgi:hypothetical protein
MNLVYCPGGDTLPYGACVPSCEDCYITVNDIDTSGGVIYEPQFINEFINGDYTDICISEETAKHNCFNNGKHWCGVLGKCMPNCNSCIDAESQTAFKLNVIAGSGMNARFLVTQMKLIVLQQGNALNVKQVIAKTIVITVGITQWKKR